MILYLFFFLVEVYEPEKKVSPITKYEINILHDLLLKTVKAVTCNLNTRKEKSEEVEEVGKFPPSRQGTTSTIVHMVGPPLHKVA